MASFKETNRPLTIRGMFRQHLIVTNRKQRTIEAYISALEQFHTFIQKSPLKCTVNDIRGDGITAPVNDHHRMSLFLQRHDILDEGIAAVHRRAANFNHGYIFHVSPARTTFM